MDGLSLTLPRPDRLPADQAALRAAGSAVGLGPWVLPSLADGRDKVLALLGVPAPAGTAAGPVDGLAQPGPVAAEQAEHDRYFQVDRAGTGAEFITGLVLAHAAAYDDCAAGGSTLLTGEHWPALFEGLAVLTAGSPVAAAELAPPAPAAHWTPALHAPTRWLVGHQLFFALIQGAITGLNCFLADGQGAGLAVSAAFLRSSAAAMRYASDFPRDDYDETVRPAMAPPAVRAGFSGLQTRDHSYLVRQFSAAKPALHAVAGSPEHAEFVEAMVSAYAAHEFICARFRGDVLPSLRMAASSGGRSQRPGVDVVRELMRARLALVDPAGGGER